MLSDRRKKISIQFTFDFKNDLRLEMAGYKPADPLQGQDTDIRVMDEAILKLENRLEQEAPSSLEAEQSLLGSILMSPDVFYIVCQKITRYDFYRHPHSLIYGAMEELASQNESIDVVTVSEQLLTGERLTAAGGRAYLADLALSVLTVDNVESYADIIKEKSILRQLIKTGVRIVDAAFTAESSQTALDTAQHSVYSITDTNQETGLTSLAKIVPEALAELTRKAESPNAFTGVQTGFHDLDAMTQGLHPGELTILAARPSMGKTALCLNIATTIGLHLKKPVLIFSMEMTKEQLFNRLWASVAEVDSQKMRKAELTPREWQLLSAAMGPLQEAPIQIDDSSGLTVMNLRAKARKAKMLYGQELGLIVVDYLQLMTPTESKRNGQDNEAVRVGEMSRALKNTAKELNCPILCLSQLSRALESRQDKKPMMSDLRSSGSIEQDADNVIFIHREEYYNKDTDRPGTADIIIAKQRNGPVGEINLLFRNNLTKFINPLKPVGYPTH
jgi:replicative DNA helicase